MTNNDVLRRLRYTFDLNDDAMMEVFSLADVIITREQLSAWLKKDDDEAYMECTDLELATFLNGFINLKRGRKEGKQPTPEKRLTHNIRFKKLKIALDLKADDILDILKLSDFDLSKHELSAFFRKKGHKHYRACQDQILRNFLAGLQKKHRPETVTESE